MGPTTSRGRDGVDEPLGKSRGTLRTGGKAATPNFGGFEHHWCCHDERGRIESQQVLVEWIIVRPPGQSTTPSGCGDSPIVPSNIVKRELNCRIGLKGSIVAVM